MRFSKNATSAERAWLLRPMQPGAEFLESSLYAYQPDNVNIIAGWTEGGTEPEVARQMVEELPHDLRPWLLLLAYQSGNAIMLSTYRAVLTRMWAIDPAAVKAVAGGSDYETFGALFSVAGLDVPDYDEEPDPAEAGPNITGAEVAASIEKRFADAEAAEKAEAERRAALRREREARRKAA